MHFVTPGTDIIKVEIWAFFMKIALSNYPLCLRQTLLPFESLSKVGRFALRLTLTIVM